MPSEGSQSALVVTTTPVTFPAVAAPMVKPVTVTSTTVLAAMDDEAISESTMAVAVGKELVAVTDVPLIAAVGIAEVAKKPLG